MQHRGIRRLSLFQISSDGTCTLRNDYGFNRCHSDGAFRRTGGTCTAAIPGSRRIIPNRLPVKYDPPPLVLGASKAIGQHAAHIAITVRICRLGHAFPKPALHRPIEGFRGLAGHPPHQSVSCWCCEDVKKKFFPAFHRVYIVFLARSIDGREKICLFVCRFDAAPPAKRAYRHSRAFPSLASASSTHRRSPRATKFHHSFPSLFIDNCSSFGCFSIGHC